MPQGALAVKFDGPNAMLVNESGHVSGQRVGPQFLLKSILVRDMQERNQSHATIEPYKTIMTKAPKDGKEKQIVEISQIAKTVLC